MLLRGKAFRIQFLGDLLVLGHQQIEVGVAHLEDAHVDIGLLEAFAPQADVLDAGDDAGEEQLTEQGQELGLFAVLLGLGGRDAEVLQDLDSP